MQYNDVQITDVDFWDGGVQISWASPSIGWGQYTMCFDKELHRMTIDSECMESPTNRDFGRMLFTKLFDVLEKEGE